MVTGSDLRRYRSLIGLTQAAFARELGIAQTTQSQIEGGRIGVSQEHLGRLRERFAGPKFSPTFDEFCSRLKADESAAIAATTAAGALYHTMTVWRWDDRFDLGRLPLPEQAAGLVTVEAGDRPRVALRMGKATASWAEGEIIVFEEAEAGALQEGELCLVQVREARFKGRRTVIAVARPAAGKRERILQFQPVSPPTPVFAADEAITGILSAYYRARYV